MYKCKFIVYNIFRNKKAKGEIHMMISGEGICEILSEQFKKAFKERVFEINQCHESDESMNSWMLEEFEKLTSKACEAINSLKY